jgi:hypothetical protein
MNKRKKVYLLFTNSNNSKRSYWQNVKDREKTKMGNQKANLKVKKS